MQRRLRQDAGNLIVWSDGDGNMAFTLLLPVVCCDSDMLKYLVAMASDVHSMIFCTLMWCSPGSPKRVAFTLPLPGLEITDVVFALDP